MKSVVALLVLAALCNGAIQKDGGLKGSWEDAFSITSTFDNTAPTVDYDGDQPFYYYETTWNITDWDTNDWDYQYVYFAIGDTDRFYYSDAAGFDISLVGGTDGEMVNDPTSCSLSSDLSVSCTFYFYGNTGSYMYAPVITAWDEQGNWASFDETAFADADRTSIQTIIDNTPDMTAPVFVADSYEITGADVTLPLSDDYSDLTYVDVSVEVNDNTDSDADTYDMYASDIMGVWAVIINADDIGADDEADLEWMEALTYDGYSGATMNKVYGATFGFANWAPLGEWRLRRFEASDRAGNWATAYSVDEAITISWDDSNEDEVTSCQTLLFNDLSSDLDATGSYASIYFTPGCTVKFSGTNYIWASFASPEYIADGDTVKDSVVVGVTSGYGYTGNTYQNLPLGYTSSAAYPGTTFYADGTSTFYLNLYDGQASEEEGEWTLYEMITFTGTGAVQRYTVELGAASSVVPSAVAVVFAAIFAMFRL